MKKIEVEMRILLKDKNAVEEALKKKGGKLVYCTQLKDYWFARKDAVGVDDALINNSGFALRIRETLDPYSGKIHASLDCKTLCDGTNHAFCNEYEVDLDEVESMRAILEALAFKQILLVDKERLMYKLDGTNFCFDTITGVGEGLEIERITEGDWQPEYDKLVKIAHELGVTDDEILEKSLTYIAMQKLAKF